MTTAALSILAALSALLTVRAEYRGPRSLVYVCKPLTVALIVLVALQNESGAPRVYQALVVAGLLCSLAGDVFLMLPRDRFLAGLACFLAAHLCYVAALAPDGGRGASAWAGLSLLAYGVWMLARLWPRLGGLKGPVVAYVVVILFMVWLALSRWLGGAGPAGGAWAAGGALLFAASDSLLAWDRFKDEFRAAQALVLSTYFAAQWLIALSA